MLLPVHHSPCDLGRTLALGEQGLALLVQEEVLLAINANIQDAPPRIDPEATEAARRCLEHHGCLLLLSSPRFCTSVGDAGTEAASRFITTLVAPGVEIYLE